MILRKLTAIAALAGAALLWPGEADAQTRLNRCQTIDESGSYVLTRNLEAAVNESCLVVAANHVTIDLAGFTVGGAGLGDGITDQGVERSNIAVRNGTVVAFARNGVSLSASAPTVIEGIRAVENLGIGIDAGHGSIVTGNTVANNDRGGIRVDVGSLVTGNIALTNGIEVTCPSNVIGNTANLTLSGDGCNDQSNVAP